MIWQITGDRIGDSWLLIWHETCVSFPGLELAMARSGELCGAVFFRHLEKTGGTSVKRLFRQRSSFTIIDAVEFTEHRWADRLIHNESFAALHPRIYVEFHSPSYRHGVFFLDLLPKLPRIRAVLARRNCVALAFTVLREPVSQILSDYLAFYEHRNHSPSSILAWSRLNADVQVRRLVMRANLPDGLLMNAAQDVLNSLDMVGITEHLDEFLRTLCFRYSIGHCRMYHHAAPPRDHAAVSVVEQVARNASLRAILGQSSRVTLELYWAWRAKWELKQCSWSGRETRPTVGALQQRSHWRWKTWPNHAFQCNSTGLD